MDTNKLEKILKGLNNSVRVVSLENKKKNFNIWFGSAETLTSRQDVLRLYLVDFAYNHCKPNNKITIYFEGENNSLAYKIKASEVIKCNRLKEEK